MASSMAATKGRVEGILVMTIVLAAVTFLVARSGAVSGGITGAGTTLSNLFKGAAGT